MIYYLSNRVLIDLYCASLNRGGIFNDRSYEYKRDSGGSNYLNLQMRLMRTAIIIYILLINYYRNLLLISLIIIMISLIIDTIWYLCCFNRNKPKEQSPFELIVINLENLAQHELEYLQGHLTKKKTVGSLRCC